MLARLQRAGYVGICTKHLQTTAIKLVNGENSLISTITLTEKGCDSAEHLLQSHVFELDLLLIVATFTFGLFVFYPLLVSMLALFKATRAPPLPYYLLFGVFRE